MKTKFRFSVVTFLLLLVVLTACSNKTQDSESELLGTLQALQTQVGQQEAGTPQPEATSPPSSSEETPPPAVPGETRSGDEAGSPLMRLTGLSFSSGRSAAARMPSLSKGITLISV